MTRDCRLEGGTDLAISCLDQELLSMNAEVPKVESAPFPVLNTMQSF